MLKQTGNLTYAEIFRKVNVDSKLEDLGNTVLKIRRTQRGELLIQLKQPRPESMEFSSKIGMILGADNNYRPLVELMNLACAEYGTCQIVRRN